MQIIPEYFIISSFITMFMLYLTIPEPKIIIKYPSVDEEKSCIYVDDANVCYKYQRIKI